MTSSSRNLAGVRELLVRAIAEDPDHFISSFRKGIAKAFRTSDAEMTAVGGMKSARDYLEFQSKLNSHKPTCNWMWLLGGILDALLAGRSKEATARTCLAIVAGEQVSMDQGSWMLAWEFTLEEEPPYASFNRSSQASGESRRLPVPVTADPRHVEVALSRLRNLDSLIEVKRRLAKAAPPYVPPAGATGSDQATPRPPKAKPPKAPKGLGKGAAEPPPQ
jgi:hypothetical protein